MLAQVYHVPEIFKTETPFGVPLGALLLIVIILRYLTNGFGESSYREPEYRPPPKRKRHASIPRWRDPECQPMPIFSARYVGAELLRIIDENAVRTGHTAESLASEIRGQFGLTFELKDGRLNITEEELRDIWPKLRGIRGYCEMLPARVS